MRLTHSYRNNTNLHDLRLMLLQSIVAFIDRQADIFEALIRNGSPFGGNWLSVTPKSTGGELSGKTGDRLVHIHQQVKTLNQTVALLNDRVEGLASQLSAETKSYPSGKPVRLAKVHQNEIGISRYRAIQQKP